MYRSKDQRKQENSECMKIITDDTLRLNMAGKCDKQHRKIADGIRTKTEKVGSVTMIKYSECKKTESNRVKTNRDKRDLDKLKLSVKNSRKRSYGIIPLADMCTKTILMKASSEPYTEIRVNIQIDKTILLKDNYCQDANTFNVRDSISSIDDYLLNRKTDSNVLSQKTKWTDQSKSSVRDILTTKSLTVDHTGKDLNKSERSTKLDSHSISNHKKSLELRDTEFFSKKSHKVYNYPGNSNVKSQESNSNCGRNLLKSQESNINCGKNLLKSLESNINCGRNLPKSQESNINCGRNLLKSQEIFTESDRNIFAVLGAKALADKLTENNRFKTEPTDTSYDNSTPLTTCSPSSASKSEKWTEIIKVKTESIDNSYGNLNSFTRPYINKSHLELRVETTQVHCSVGSSSPLRQTAEKNENDITSDYEGSSTGLPSEDEDIKEEALEPVRCSSLQTDTQPEFDEDLPMLISPQRKKMKLEDKTTVAQMKPPKDSLKNPHSFVFTSSRGRNMEGRLHCQFMQVPGGKLKTLCHIAHSKLQFVQGENIVYFIPDIQDICSLDTDRNSNHEELYLQSSDNNGNEIDHVEKFKSSILEIENVMRSINCKVVFATITTMSFFSWNMHRYGKGETSDLKSCDSYFEMQKKLNSCLHEINKCITRINCGNHVITPFLHTCVHKCCKGKIRYIYNKLVDGVHPGDSLSEKWIEIMNNAIAKNERNL
ncbi:uncharacterized protein LOC127700987 isoform X2 [Mytilus californianus]|uniref:uncharacterized protein LOC127700987 isoform X2 n=1 Tax=Mytilus californianus TaxID=6549 RepID=UPI002247BFDB|nr:uncharacterized protein LOC127700987 isoform X2 [Mytilus californianus]